MSELTQLMKKVTKVCRDVEEWTHPHTHTHTLDSSSDRPQCAHVLAAALFATRKQTSCPLGWRACTPLGPVVPVDEGGCDAQGRDNQAWGAEESVATLGCQLSASRALPGDLIVIP